MTREQADACTLWIFHAHCHDAAEHSPILVIKSPTPECGKTTLLTIVSKLVPRPLATSNVTTSALFRITEKWHPTIFIDEADTFLGDHEELRGLLNSGHYRDGGLFIRSVGDKWEVRGFNTWSAKCIALIGKVHPSLASRNIPIELLRLGGGVTVEPLRKAAEILKIQATLIARWCVDNLDGLRRADPDMPSGLRGRDADNWRSMLSIADRAGGTGQKERATRPWRSPPAASTRPPG